MANENTRSPESAEHLVGLTKEEALEKLGSRARIMGEDGEGFFGTMDHKPYRVNLEIKDGIVVRAYYG